MKKLLNILLHIVKYCVIGWLTAVFTCLIVKDSANYNFYFVYGMVISLAVDFLYVRNENKKS